MTKENKIIENLHSLAITTGSQEMHMVLPTYKEDEKITVVYSVYNKQHPSHKVLDELYNWAEETDNTELLNKLEELSTLEK